MFPLPQLVISSESVGSPAKPRHKSPRTPRTARGAEPKHFGPKVRNLLDQLSTRLETTSKADLGRLQPHEKLFQLSSAFGEVIDHLPSYKPLLLRIHDEYNALVQSLLKNGSNADMLRNTLKAEAGKLKRLEADRTLFQGEQCWSESCALRRQLKTAEVESQNLQKKLKDIQFKCQSMSKQWLDDVKKGDSQLQNSRKLFKGTTQSLQKERWKHACHFAVWSNRMVHAVLAKAQDSGPLPDSDENLPEVIPSGFLEPDTHLAVPMLGIPELDRGAKRRRSTRRLSPIAFDDQPEGLSRILSNKSGASMVKDLSRHPEMWGMTVAQLVDFYEDIEEDLPKYCSTHSLLVDQDGHRIHICHETPCMWSQEGKPHATKFWSARSLPQESARSLMPIVPDMHLVVDLFVKPMTEEYDTSYSLMVNEEGLSVNIFVTHVWSDEFPHLIEILRTALSDTDVAWVCSFAIPQNNSDKIKDLLDKEDLRESPFGVALQFAMGYLVVLDSKACVPSRAWCTYEIGLASSLGKPIHLWPHRSCDFKALHSEIELLDLENAEASNKTDEGRIKAEIIAKMGGFKDLNEKVKDLMRDKVRFAQQFLDRAQKEELELKAAYQQEWKKEQDELEAKEQEINRLNKKLERALADNDISGISKLCKEATDIKMDDRMKTYWAALNELRFQIELAPFKANQTPIKAIQLLCTSLDDARKTEADANQGLLPPWCKQFGNTFDEQLSEQMGNAKAEIVACLARSKLPANFFSFFLPQQWAQRQDQMTLEINQNFQAANQPESKNDFDDCLKRLNELNAELEQHIFEKIADAKLVRALRDEVTQMTHVMTKQEARASSDHQSLVEVLEEERKRSREEAGNLSIQLREKQDQLHMKDKEFREEVEKVKKLEGQLDQVTEHWQERLKVSEESRMNISNVYTQLEKQHALTVQRNKFDVQTLKTQLETTENKRTAALRALEVLQSECDDYMAQVAEETMKNKELFQKNFSLRVSSLKPQREDKKPKISMQIMSEALVKVACDEDAPFCRCGWCGRFQSTFHNLLAERVLEFREDVDDFLSQNCHPEFPTLFLGAAQMMGRTRSVAVGGETESTSIIRARQRRNSCPGPSIDLAEWFEQRRPPTNE